MVSGSVTPAKAGVKDIPEKLDSGLRRNDMLYRILAFYENLNL
jgi:hypothetical protein